MTQPLAYIHICGDADGESHIERLAIPMSTAVFAPPAPALDISTAAPAEACALLRLPCGWWGEWHPTPFRQWLLFLAGAATMYSSDGQQCAIAAGSIVLLEDVAGKGHQTRVAGSDEVIIASVRIPSRDDG